MGSRLCAFAVWLFSAVFSYAGQQAPYRAEVNLVNITAVVHSSEGKLITNQNKDDFELSEDGVPQTIRFFARESELPLSLGLIVDVSGSQEKFLKRHDHDIETFLKTVIRPSDELFAVCFGNHLRLVSAGTSSVPGIMQGFQRFPKEMARFPEIGPHEDRDLGTALYDAIYFSIVEKIKAAGERRRALIVFSDGEENSSEHDLLDAIAAAQDTDTLLYCIRYTHKEHGQLSARNKYGVRVMDHLATLTGGAHYDGLATHLETVFGQIGDELRAMYEFGYVSNNSTIHDGSFRKLTIRCKAPGAIVRSKSGYYAR
ncbi:MAG: VWA domain-containing protein [Acidobacteriaceae bacterium]|nr:VWA domain-containing protein [Acidobacteriaceae bacterium]